MCQLLFWLLSFENSTNSCDITLTVVPWHELPNKEYALANLYLKTKHVTRINDVNIPVRINNWRLYVLTHTRTHTRRMNACMRGQTDVLRSGRLPGALP